MLEEIIADIDNGLRVEDEGFAELIVGSAVRSIGGGSRMIAALSAFRCP